MLVQDKVDEIISEGIITRGRSGDRTTVLAFTHPEVGTLRFSSSCHDARHYDHEKGTEVCKLKLRKELWSILGHRYRPKKEDTPTSPCRQTEDELEDLITAEAYHVFSGTTTTVCCLTLVNGFNVVGHSACVDPENFDAETGRQIAREKAFSQLWKLEGYLLKQRMFEGLRPSCPAGEGLLFR